jgi:hypothetical protein
MVKVTTADGTVFEGTPEELHVLIKTLGVKSTPDDEYVKVTDREPRKGDYVKFDDDFAAHKSWLTPGKYYQIIEIDEYGDPQILDDDEDAYDTDGDNFEVYEKASVGNPEDALFNIGDYARLRTANSRTLNGFKTGEFVKILDDTGGTSNFMVTNGNTIGFTDADNLEKLNEKELSFVKAGRKPNEFKQGDIVIDKHFGLCEVAEVEPEGFCDADRGLTTTNGKWTYKHHCTLVAPVEQRVDRDGAAK